MSLKIEPEYFRKQLKWLNVLGIDIRPVENVWYAKIFRVYSVFLFSYLFLFTILETVDTLRSTDFNGMTFGLSYAGTHILGAVKMCILFAKKNVFHQMLSKLESDYFTPNEERGGETEFRLIKAAVRRTNIHADIFNTLAYLIIGIRCLYAILDKGIYIEYTDEYLNSTTIKHLRTLPYKTWFPVDLNKSPAFEIVFFYQASCLILYGFLICYMDAIVYGMMIHMKTQYIILRHLLNRYVAIAKCIVLRNNPDAVTEDKSFGRINIPKGMEKDPVLTPQVQEVIQRIVHYSVRYHQEILEYCDKIENEFRYLMLLQFLSSLYILCFQLFQLSLVSNYFSFESISMCFYLILIMYQLLCYCYYGNEVKLQSSNFAIDLYNTEWLLTNNSIKKSLLLMMIRAQRPTEFTAGKFALLSLQTYVAIVRGSASYFMVLRQMQ